MRTLYESILDSDEQVAKRIYDNAHFINYDVKNMKYSWIEDINADKEGKIGIRIFGTRHYGWIYLQRLTCKKLVLDVNFEEVDSTTCGFSLEGCKIGNLQELIDKYKSTNKIKIKADTDTLRKSGIDLTCNDQVGVKMNKGDYVINPVARARGCSVGQIKSFAKDTITATSGRFDQETGYVIDKKTYDWIINHNISSEDKSSYLHNSKYLIYTHKDELKLGDIIAYSYYDNSYKTHPKVRIARIIQISPKRIRTKFDLVDPMYSMILPPDFDISKIED